MIERIGYLDESVEFYCSDDVYIRQLKENNIKHALVTTSVVNHLEHLTLIKEDAKSFEHLTVNQVKKYNKLFNENRLGWGV